MTEVPGGPGTPSAPGRPALPGGPYTMKIRSDKADRYKEDRYSCKYKLQKKKKNSEWLMHIICTS